MTLAPVDGTGQYVTLSNVSFTNIPLYIRDGTVLLLRAVGTMTTTELRTQAFQFFIVPGMDGTATGALYINDSVSIMQDKTTSAKMAYVQGKLTMSGLFEVDTELTSMWFLGIKQAPTSTSDPGYKLMQFSYNAVCKVL